MGTYKTLGLGTLQSTTASVTSSNSTAVYEVLSSVTGQGHHVYALSLTSTASTPLLVECLSSAASDKWAVLLGSGSSGVAGFTASVTPPASLFQTSTGEALNLRLGSTAVAVRITVGYLSES